MMANDAMQSWCILAVNHHSDILRRMMASCLFSFRRESDCMLTVKSCAHDSTESHAHEKVPFVMTMIQWLLFYTAMTECKTDLPRIFGLARVS
jgi:hypothetical protein